MSFDNPCGILDILLDTNKRYNELEDYARELSHLIKTLHKFSTGYEFPSAIMQCVLECYRIKNNYSSSNWFFLKDCQNIQIKQNEQPVKFSIKNNRNEIIKYELYNENQILNANTFDNEIDTIIYKLTHGLLTNKIPSIKDISKVFDVSEERIFQIKNNSIPKESLELSKTVEKEDLKDAIISFVSQFRGQYGRSGVAKILKGSQSLKDNAFNTASKNSKYYGMFNDLTIANITSKIDELIEDKILIIKKVSFGRPTLDVGDSYREKIIEKEDDDDNIKKIFSLLKNGRNVFITGHAGTGKSYILNKLKQRIKHLVITSTTGIAAVNVKGQTLHSWCGVGICNKPIEQTLESIMKKPSIKKQIEKCKLLAIDEISMLDIKTFEYVDEILKLIRKNDLPFGGIQLILIGDFFQLPPVEFDKNAFEKYCFESKIWNDLNPATVILTKSYRQNEQNFIKALANMRINSLDNDDIRLLNTRTYNNCEDLSDILHIFATNSEADSYNAMKFQSINAPQYVLSAVDGIYHGKDFYQNPTNEKDINLLNRIDMVCNAEKNISLKIGARVMLLVNLDFDKGLINGSCGIVKDIKENYIKITFDNGITQSIERHEFEFYNNDVLIASRKQYPLKLAYGITIHKSQGMSLDKLFVDCSRIFEKGQAYVAISRIKTLKGLYLKNFTPEKVMVDSKIVDFYNNLQS